MTTEENLNLIATQFRKAESYPFLSISDIRNTIRQAVGALDRRAFFLYLQRIQSNVKETEFRFIFDVSNFCQSQIGQEVLN